MRLHSLAIHVASLVLCVLPVQAALAQQGGSAKPLQTFLDRQIDGRLGIGVSVGIGDQQGTQIFSAGKLGNGTDQAVDGDTLFEIGSITKTFTALLLEDMVARDEMKFDDPVKKYLPDSVALPSRNGRQIT